MSTKYKLRITGECKQNMKLCKRRGLPMDELWAVVGKLLNGEQLEEKYQAHLLTGDRKGQWECHIQPDWLLVWEIRDQELVLVLLNTGTHSDLFSKKYKKKYTSGDSPKSSKINIRRDIERWPGGFRIRLVLTSRKHIYNSLN
jgi:mRNA interferase YafQ